MKKFSKLKTIIVIWMGTFVSIIAGLTYANDVVNNTDFCSCNNGMQASNITNVIKECKKLSSAARCSFPAVIKKLMEVGIERYHADLVRLEKTYYGKGIESYRDEIPLSASKGIEEMFCEEGVRSAINDRIGGEIDYATFMHRLMKSGVVSYTVFIMGEQVHYVGRKGEIWVQHFPRK